MRAILREWVSQRKAVRISGLIVLGLAASACERKQNAYVPPPPAEVTVASPIRKVVPETMEFTGVTRGYEVVEVRARVKGFLEKKLVEGGRRVKAGDLLFVIDPRTFEAAVRQARAERETQRANLRLAEVTLERMLTAMRSNAASQQEVDKAQADFDAAKARVEVAEAMLAAAELDLEFTQIRAPINGRLGLVRVDVGQLVGATEPTLLTTIINDEKIYAEYDMDEQTVLEVRRLNANRRPGEDGRPSIEVRLALANEQGYPHVGQFHTADNTVNPETGTVRIEAIFDNADGTILPGSFVRVQPIYGEREALLVPDVAVQTDQNGRFVLVVNAENVVERRNITAGPTLDGLRRVDSGLAGDEAVIINGLQRARPGAKVSPKRAAAAK
jgi:RND family efflux transporter MFP subunit